MKAISCAVMLGLVALLSGCSQIGELFNVDFCPVWTPFQVFWDALT